MAEMVIPSDLFVNGHLRALTVTLPNSSVSNASVASGANVDAAKLQHQHRAGHSQPNTTATTETRAVHYAYGAGTIVAFHAGSIAANIGAATVTVDLRKNGTTVLSSVVTLDSGNTARVSEAGTVSVTSYAAGDLLEVVITATAGGGTLATGVYCYATLNENPS